MSQADRTRPGMNDLLGRIAAQAELHVHNVFDAPELDVVEEQTLQTTFSAALLNIGVVPPLDPSTTEQLYKRYVKVLKNARIQLREFEQ